MKIVTRFLHAVAGLLGWHPTATTESSAQKRLSERFNRSMDVHERRREALASRGSHKHRGANPTRCRCFTRLLGAPFCKVHRREVRCRKHRHYICLDCGNRDRISGRVA